MRRFREVVSATAIAFSFIGGTIPAAVLVPVAAKEAEAQEQTSAVYIYEDDEVKLKDYHSIPYTASVQEITDADVEEDMNFTAQEYCTYEKIMDGRAKYQDMVAIDYTALMDGEEFDADKNFILTIGDGFMPDELEAGIVGMTPGTKKQIHVIFSADYGEEMDGKEADFDVTLNYICGEAIVPEVTDSFVKENLGFDSVEKFREETRKQLEESARSSFEFEKEEQVMASFMELGKVDEGLIDMEQAQADADESIEQYKAIASMFGMSYEEFLENQEMTEEEFRQRALEDAAGQQKLDILMKKTAQLEGVKCTGEDAENFLKDMADEYGETLDELKKEIEDSGDDPVEYAKEQVIAEKVKKILMDGAVQVSE